MSPEPSKEIIDGVTLKRLEIEAEEPPILRVVDILCHNELLRAQGYDPTIEATLYYDVSPLQRFFAPLFDIRAHNIKPFTTKPSEF